MAIAVDVIRDFVKNLPTSDGREVGDTLNGTARISKGITYVQIDGSDQLTPIASSTAGVKDGDRVLVTIKAHQASITGNISDPAAGTSTTDEIKQQVATINTLIADKISVDDLDADLANIKKLLSDEATINKIRAGEITVEEVLADAVKAGAINAASATIVNLGADAATITSLVADYVSVKDLSADSAKFNTVETIFAKVEELHTNYLNAKEIEAKYLSVENANAKFANIDFGNIGKAAIEKFLSTSGVIGAMQVDKNGAVIAGILQVVKIDGDLINANTIAASKIVLKGEDGLFYDLNTQGIKVAENQNEYNSLNGSVLTVNSVTADKMNVNDLSAVAALIGGINLTDGKIYSGVKESVDNTTAGFYLDKAGQFALGDGTSYLRFYKDDSGKWQFALNFTGYATTADVQAAVDGLSSTIASTYAKQSTVDELQNIADNAIESWQGEGEPTLTNLPASAWSTDKLKKQHAGDIYIDTNTGYTYRFGEGTDSTYSWSVIKDTDITKAIGDAKDAKDAVEALRTEAAETYSTKSELKQTEDSITSTVEKTYLTKSDASSIYATSSSLTQTEKSITAKVTSAQSTADSAASAAKTAQSTADTAKANAATAQTTANNALTAANKGISKVEVQYAQNQSTTTAPTDGWSTTAPTWKDGYYVWQKTVTTYKDGSTTESAATCISGAKGADGKDGVGYRANLLLESDVANLGHSATSYPCAAYYLANGADTIEVGKTYTITVHLASNTGGRYMGLYFNGGTYQVGNKETWINLVDGNDLTYSLTFTTRTNPATKTHICVYVRDSRNTYGSQSINTVLDRIMLVEGDQPAEWSYAASELVGNGVSSITPQYYLSTSATECTGGSWSTTMPTWTSGTYIWTRSHVVYTDGTTEDTTAVLDNQYNDLAEQITTTSSELTQTRNSITATVSETKELLDERTLADDGKTVLEKITQLTVDNDSVTASFKELKNSISTGGVSYIRMGTISENGSTVPCLVLGADNSNLSLCITNSYIYFMQGTEKTAYITNNKFRIANGVLTESLSIGSESGGLWEWKQRANGHLGLRYTG